MKRLVLAALLALTACERVPPVEAPPDLPATAPIPAEERAVAEQPLPQAVESASAVIKTPVADAIAALDGLSPPADPPAPVDARSAACRRAAASLIIRWEVSSEAWYTRRLQFPIWPGGASGVTWGIGYDGGHQTARVVLEDWQAHDHRDRLGQTAGLTGAKAKAALQAYRDISTAYGYASQVFEDRSLVEYERRTERAFRDGFDQLRPNACAALVSTVYNRGAAMAGDSRREMRALRDGCVPSQDYACMARELRSMSRLWRGTVNENGLTARREAEARLVETP